MEKIKQIIIDLQSRLVSLGFTEEQIKTVLYEIVIIASTKLSEQDLSFLTKEELDFVSNKDVMEMSPEQILMVTQGNENLARYLDIYSSSLKLAISEFEAIIQDVSKPENEQSAISS